MIVIAAAVEDDVTCGCRGREVLVCTSCGNGKMIFSKRRRKSNAWRARCDLDGNGDIGRDQVDVQT